MKWNYLYKASIPNIEQTDYYINVNEGHQFSMRELRELVCINSIYCQIIVGEIKFSPPFQEMKTQFLVRLYKVYCGQHCSVQMREWGIVYCWISLSLSLSLSLSSQRTTWEEQLEAVKVCIMHINIINNQPWPGLNPPIYVGVVSSLSFFLLFDWLAIVSCEPLSLWKTF